MSHPGGIGEPRDRDGSPRFSRLDRSMNIAFYMIRMTGFEGAAILGSLQTGEHTATNNALSAPLRNVEHLGMQRSDLHPRP